MLRTQEIRDFFDGRGVVLYGWVQSIRQHGKMMFIDLRDRFGQVQCVVFKTQPIWQDAIALSKESCIQISGVAVARPAGKSNEKLDSGDFEVKVDSIKVLNDCPVLPFELRDETVSEELRLKHRFLELRDPQLRDKLVFRSQFIKAIRHYFYDNDFVEVETPLLGKSTPEGAREYKVPSRLHEDCFYALPQSPQIYKQLLMMGGMDRYFQIAKCLRDEECRSDRQPEFTQLDVEMSFVEPSDIYDLVEECLFYTFNDTLDYPLPLPFPRLTYREAMEKYGTDKPRISDDEYSFVWITDFPMFEMREGKIKSAHHPFCMVSDPSKLTTDPLSLTAQSYDLVLNGNEILSGSIRVHDAGMQRDIFKALGMNDEQISRFDFMLEALSYGAPPHGGFAMGLDRVLQILTKSASIREVIAFPKNQNAQDIMLGAPSKE